MYLKNLELQGFKSFADRITLEFHDGITAVVGPNGSGKSNISDAIRWVLGEQSAKNLRGSKMEDVIFTGTEHRKALGYAEVNLTIDNADRALPVDFGEVTVTRRVYRSGESEYLLNNTHCRLKDIYELFLDTGVGRDGYSVIGQGKIDEILSTKSEERRAVFEEASGIMKYKVRKTEAERKLEHTSQNLERIGDIIFELESQLEPLFEQSETAKKFLGLRDELKDIEVSLFLHNIDSFSSKIEDIIKLMQQQRSSIEQEKSELETITKENQGKTELNQRLDFDIQKDRDLYYSIESQSERHLSDIKVNEERIVNLSENIKRLQSEIVELSERLGQFDNDQQARQKKLDYLNKQLNDFSNKLRGMEDKYKEMLVGLSDSEREIETAKAGLMDTMDILADKRLQAGNVRLQVEGIKKRQANIKNEIYHNKLEIEKEGMLVEDLEDSVSKHQKQVNGLNQAIQNGLNEKKDILASIDVHTKDLEKDISQRQYKTARLKMLKDMESNMEGYSRSVKELLRRAKQDESFGRGIKGALVQLISMSKTYETAIEMVLGNALQNIVTETDIDAKRCIETIRQGRFGRATFLPIESVRGRLFEKGMLERMKRMEGFVGVASDLVECDPVYRQIIESLLGRTAVIDCFENARKISRSFDNTVKLVTLEGDIFNPGGSITGGHNESSDSGLLSRSREIPQLETEIGVIHKKIMDKEELQKELKSQLKEVEKELALNQTRHREAELIVLRDTTHLKQVHGIIDRIKSKNEMLQAEFDQLIHQSNEENIEAGKYEEEISQLEHSVEAFRHNIDSMNDAHKQKVSQREVYYEDITNYKLSVNSIQESIQGVEEDRQKLTEDREAIQRSIERKENEQRRLTAESQKLTEKNAEIAELINQASNQKDEIQVRIDEASAHKKALEAEMFGIIEVLNKKNESIQLLQEDIGKMDVKKAKLETELEGIIDKLWNEYQLTTITAEQYRKPVVSVQASQRRVNELKEEIRKLGTINVAAIEDYIKTQERYDFMNKQRDDLEEAKKKLHKVIDEMMHIMKKQFAEQFKIINRNFGEVFRELFNGGRAELKLADETDILECGIDIIVQPPGKKLQNMMLLSGGEKALTAIALLFAILKMRPTPFCILDEIEAALDEANVQRFGQYLRNFSDNTQFIVVTHRKGTMEISDSLYGVTMQEHGISKLVSLKLNEKMNVR